MVGGPRVSWSPPPMVWVSGFRGPPPDAMGVKKQPLPPPPDAQGFVASTRCYGINRLVAIADLLPPARTVTEQLCVSARA